MESKGFGGLEDMGCRWYRAYGGVFFILQTVFLLQNSQSTIKNIQLFGAN